MNPLLVPEPRASSKAVIMQTAMALIAHAVLDDAQREMNPTGRPKDNLLRRGLELPERSDRGSYVPHIDPAAEKVIAEAQEARRLRAIKKQAQGHWSKP